jgi:hypothetical protein
VKSYREIYGEFRARFGSVPGVIDSRSGLLATMIGAFRSVWLEGLLIRRSWVRNPPGSYSENVAFLPRTSPLPLGEFTGNPVADHPRDRVPLWLQFTCWKVFAAALIAAQVSCMKEAIETRRTDNTSVTVDLLFT